VHIKNKLQPVTLLTGLPDYSAVMAPTKRKEPPKVTNFQSSLVAQKQPQADTTTTMWSLYNRLMSKEWLRNTRLRSNLRHDHQRMRAFSYQ